jgi:Xaa-Pro aminopeptidase
MEYEIEAELTQKFVGHGGDHAYNPIVAAGLNATILHYVKNNKALVAGEIVLIDSGAEYANYAADITRVFPVGGQLSERQQAVYDAVLRVKKYAESILKPGILIKEYEQQVGAKMNDELIELGLLPEGSTLKSTKSKPAPYRTFYPHGTSHFLGLDVHDVGDYSQPLKPGMVLTCEPGIYIREEGIGVRLEDDILITKDGSQNLSASIPI